MDGIEVSVRREGEQAAWSFGIGSNMNVEIVSGKIQWQPPSPLISKRSPRVPTPRS